MSVFKVGAKLLAVQGEGMGVVLSRGVTRRGAENCRTAFLSTKGREEKLRTPFVRGGTLRGAEDRKSVVGFLRAATQRVAGQRRFVSVNYCSGEGQRALVGGRAQIRGRAWRWETGSYP